MLPSRERLIAPISKVSPPAVKGISKAKMINGNSMVARLAKVHGGNFDIPIARKIIRKYPTNEGHCWMGVRTAMMMKLKNATSLIWPGNSWMSEWRCIYRRSPAL